MVSAVIEQVRPCADKSMSRITIISAAILEFCPSVTSIVDARLEEVAALMFVTPRSAGARFDRRYDPVMARATLFSHRHKPVSRRGLLVSLSASLVALSVLVGCGQSNEYAANPAPYEVPAAELARASSAEFKPLIAALLSLRAATKAMNDYRLAQPRVLDEAQQKKYEELRAVSAMLAAEVAKRVQAAQFSTEQLATWEVISALPPDELQKLGH